MDVRAGPFALASRFTDRFGGTPRIFRAPGRVNLIGEHTDYNDGFVMPAAIQFATRVAIAPRTKPTLTIYSENVCEEAIFELDDPNSQPRRDWTDYIRGVAISIERSGRKLTGANLLVQGDVPLGAGLSSSASVEVATAFALLATANHEIDRAAVALLCQRAENEFVGARCGIMDQFTACHGRANHALLLDCRSLEARALELPADVSVAVCNTMVKHELASGEYNVRRQQCEDGVRILSHFLPGVQALRDVTLEELDRYGNELDPVIQRRCRHVVSENARVLKAAEALDRADLNQFGSLMRASHYSLRDDYEVSCLELDIMVELASEIEGVYGSRMTGGGFGGCTVSLVEASRTGEFVRTIRERYLNRTGIRPEVYLCRAADGAGEELK